MADWQTVRSDSRVLTAVRTGVRRTAIASTESRVLNRLREANRLLTRAGATSRVGTTGRILGRWTRDSWLFRWLTKEPDPDVIVIDLRETWTVGPVIAGIDWLASKIQQAVHRTGLHQMGHGVKQVVRTAPVQILGIVAFLAVLVNTLATVTVRGLTESGLGARLILLAVATLMTRVDASWDDLRDGRVGSLCRAVFEPPEVPDDASEKTEDR